MYTYILYTLINNIIISVSEHQNYIQFSMNAMTENLVIIINKNLLNYMLSAVGYNNILIGLLFSHKN